MGESPSEQFGYDATSRVRDVVVEKILQVGGDADKVRDGVILGSGLGSFAADHIDPVVTIPFADIHKRLAVPPSHNLAGHAKNIVIGTLKGTVANRLVFAQNGREHPYEGISTQRATLWLRVMQLLGVETLIGSNAAGILTPRTLNVGDLMLVNSDKDFGADNPLRGGHETRFGPRFPHMNNVYSASAREKVQRAAEQVMGKRLPEGLYIRMPGPEYERPETVYELRALAQTIWEGAAEQGDPRFKNGPTAVVGMSSTFEQLVAQHASQSIAHPAFQKGRAYISVATNYAAGLGLPEASSAGDAPDHSGVEESARKAQGHFGALVRAALIEMRKTGE